MVEHTQRPERQPQPAAPTPSPAATRRPRGEGHAAQEAALVPATQPFSLQGREFTFEATPPHLVLQHELRDPRTRQWAPPGDAAVMAQATPRDNIALRAGHVGFTGQVSVRRPEALEAATPGSVNVGPIQTLVSSRRVAIYQDAQGNEVARHQSRLANLWDGARGGVPPFYAPPIELSQDVPSTRDSGPGQVSFIDQPQLEVPAEKAGGRLAATEGSDDFVVSLGVMHGSRVHHLTHHRWSVPWNARIRSSSATPTPTGSQVEIGDAPAGVATMNGMTPNAAHATHNWTRYGSVDAAMRMPTAVLISELPNATRNEPAAGRTIAEALLRKNPKLEFELKVEASADGIGDAEINVHCWGAQNAARTADIPVGRHETFEIPIAELWQNANELTPDASVGFRVWDGGLVTHGGGRTADRWRFPFSRKTMRIEGSDGERYVIRGKRIKD